MSFRELHEAILATEVEQIDRIHLLRIARVVINIEDHAQRHSSDDRLLHLMSRVGVFADGLADALEAGEMSTKTAALLLRRLADVGAKLHSLASGRVIWSLG